MHGFFRRRAVRVVGIVALLVVVVVLLFFVFNWYVAPTKPSERKDLVLAVAQILGGTALLSGLYFTWRTLQVNREGQITDRFTRAIDQLGSESLEIRLGGIYALERIARESEEDYWPIIEILTAYVRQNAPWPPGEGQGGTDDATEEQSALEDFGGEDELTLLNAPDPDIQAIMTILRRRKRDYMQGEPEGLDLRKTKLARVDLSEADLHGAILSGANLHGANLFRANLSEQAILYRADLSGAHLLEANLYLAFLTSADLSRANLTRANLHMAFLSQARFTGANLSEADLSEAGLSEADLAGAILYRADLSGAQHLTQEQLEQTTGDADTKLPPHLKPPAHWGVKTDEQTEGG